MAQPPSPPASETSSRPATPSAAAATPPATPYSTRPAESHEAPHYRRSREDSGRLRACCERLEALQHRIAHTLGADDLAALSTVLGELQAMAGMPEVAPAPA